jgi:hypothetical protein|tara:strand:+ start:133 stop:372 length:240 start_codon:yes stop_codon:yes gene_type:complete
MKTMMNLDGTQIVRVSDEKASRLFGEGYRYVAKSIWKEKVRDIDKEVHNSPLGDGFAHKDTKSNKMSKAQKRHLKKSNK